MLQCALSLSFFSLSSFLLTSAHCQLLLSLSVSLSTRCAFALSSLLLIGSGNIFNATPACTVLFLLPFLSVCVCVFFLISLFLFCSVSQFSCATFGPWLWQREDPEDSTQGLHLKIIYCATAHTHTATHTNTDTNYLSLFILVLVERTLNCWPKHLTRLWSGRVLAWLFPALFKNCLCFTRATTSFLGNST